MNKIAIIAIFLLTNISVFAMISPMDKPDGGDHVAGRNQECLT